MNLEQLIKRYEEYLQNVEKFINIINKVMKEVAKKEGLEIPYEITITHVGDIKHSFVIQGDKRLEILDPINVMKHVHKCLSIQECLDKISFEIPTLEDLYTSDIDKVSELRLLLTPVPLVVVDREGACVTGTWLIELLKLMGREDVKIPVVKLGVTCAENPILCLELFKWFDFPVLKLPKGYIYYMYQVYPYVMSGVVVTEHEIAQRFKRDKSTISKAITYFLDKFKSTPVVFQILDELRKRVTPVAEAKVEVKPEVKPTVEITVSEAGEVEISREEVTPPPTPPQPQPQPQPEIQPQTPTPTAPSPPTPPSVEEVGGVVEKAVEVFAEEEAKRLMERIEEAKAVEKGFEIVAKIKEEIKKREAGEVVEKISPPTVEVSIPVEEKKLTFEDLVREFIGEISSSEVVDIANRYIAQASKAVAEECRGMDIRKCIDNKLRERAAQMITLKTYLEQAKVPQANEIAKLIVLALGPRKTSSLIEEVKDALNLGIDVLDILRDYSEDFEQISIPRDLRRAVVTAIRTLVEYERTEVPHEVTGNTLIRFWLRQLVDVLDALYELRGKLSMRDLIARLREIVREGFRVVFGRDLKKTVMEGEEEVVE